LTDSLKINSVEYSFEEKYNGVEITTIKIPTTMVDIININDSIRYFKVIEDKSGQLSFWNLNTTWNITLQRYQKDSDIVIHNWAGTNYQRDYQFHANKGLINYTNGKGPISNQYSENYKLDSVKLIH
jgi:ribosomal protein S4E